jgi:hypothetical protein
MTEEFLHYIWNHKLFKQKTYLASTGEEVSIIKTGEHNFNAGPDFSNTQLKIEDTLWVGNCELHVRASDWYKHNHHVNAAFNNVILHVVYENDSNVSCANGEIVPSIVLEFDERLQQNYQNLLASTEWVACQSQLKLVDHFIINQFITKLCIERLEKRTEEISQTLEQTKNHWEEAFYRYLAKHFGFKVNSVPFELLAKSLPLIYLAKHKNNLLQIEALLFGQSGMLEQPDIADDYYLSLQKEYKFLKQKLNLKPIECHLWKFMRLRPANFPTIRIAQFAALIHKSSALLSRILETPEPENLVSLLKACPSEYWKNHYRFGKQSEIKSKPLSDNSIHLLLINALAPFIFVYSKTKNINQYRDLAINILEQMPVEENSIINNWKKLGIKPSNAFDSQALLQLKNEYCNHKKCLQCMIGNTLIRKVNEV